VVVVVGGLETIHLTRAYSDLNHGALALADASSVLGRTPETWDKTRVAKAEPLRAEAEEQLKSGQAALRDDALLKVARALPWAGDQARAAQHIADGGVAGAQAFGDVLQVAAHYADARTAAGPPGGHLLDLLSASATPLAQAHARLAPPLADLRADMGRSLLGPLRRRVEQAVTTLGPVDDQAAAGAVAGRYAPAALGGQHPVTYLLLMANPAELRPAGGLVSSAGFVTFDRGTATALEIHPDGVYNTNPTPPFEIPYPLTRYLVFTQQSAGLNEANWDPDFPSSARFSQQIFEASTHRTVDGTICIDPYAIAAVLGVTGPITVAPYGEFNSANFFSKLDFIVNVSKDPGTGKQALGPISQAVLQKVLGQPITTWPKLLAAYQAQAASRHIQTWFVDTTLEAGAAAAHYDGALVPTNSDYVMVADGNVGATKGDFYVHKSQALKVEVKPTGQALHQLDLTYNLPPAVDATDTALNPYGGSYGDYFRVYLPDSTQLTHFAILQDGKDTGAKVDQVGYDHGKMFVGAYFKLPRGHEVKVSLEYLVPLGAGRSYSLFVQKQAGIPERPLDLHVSYPGNQLRANARLDRDAGWRVAW
jgi:hypothetical protein